MSSFSISDAAKVEIADIIRNSRCLDPVITLRDEATLDLPPALRSAVKRGMTDAESREVRLRSERLLENPASGALSVDVFERVECRPEDLSEIDGFTLAMTVQMREALGNYCLHFIDGRFMLVSPDEAVFNLRSVKTLAKWFA